MKSRTIIVGNSRSGKTTLANKLLRKNEIFVDILDYVFEYLKKENISQSEANYSLLKIPYENLCQDFANGKEWNLLEIASDFPEEYIPKIVATSKIPIKLIFCQSDLSSCLKRNERAIRQVPAEIIRNQNQYDEIFYRALCGRLGLQFSVY